MNFLLDEISKDIFIKLENFNKDINDGFSKGTTDQLFLALRLALIEHYEKDVKLPIVLDEIFANWDDERIENFIKLLSRISNERQFIILTCKSSNGSKEKLWKYEILKYRKQKRIERFFMIGSIAGILSLIINLILNYSKIMDFIVGIIR